MSKPTKKTASNFDINKGSILLLFDEVDAKITRDWPNAAHSERKIDNLEGASAI